MPATFSMFPSSWPVNLKMKDRDCFANVQTKQCICTEQCCVSGKVTMSLVVQKTGVSVLSNNLRNYLRLYVFISTYKISTYFSEPLHSFYRLFVQNPWQQPLIQVEVDSMMICYCHHGKLCYDEQDAFLSILWISSVMQWVKHLF